MHPFEKRIETVAAKATHALAPDVYAVSFYVTCNEDDLRQIELHISHNTLENLESAIEDASDAAEAKWNFAFWSQEPDAVIAAECDEVDDEKGRELREQWLNDLGLNYTQEEEDEDFDRVSELCEKIEAEFYAMAARVAKRQHDSAVITNTFGAPIPIVVHELEYHEQIVAVTKAANPPGVADEFADWVDSM